ncbi:Putative ABC transporter substrate-binding protein YesO [Streptomyces malaysiensis subsp. malaysiensis]|nr:sugar ABC transporter substrate-binding protein [Streptomyces sp. SID8382]AUA17211.1 Putative ABC transporter substrate-binding protein YesO [Streptomyces sp. M56]
MNESGPSRAPLASPLSRRRLLRLGAASLTAVSAGAALSACGWSGQNADRSSTLRVQNWGSADEAKVYDATFAAFRRQHPGLKVSNNVVPVTLWGDYVSKLAVQMASGHSPDLLNLGMEGTRLSVERSMLAPLGSRVKDSPAAFREHISELPKALLDAYTVDGTLYAVPNGWQTMMVYCNPRIFRARGVELPAADWTWEDFLSTARRLTGGGVMGFGLPWGFFQLHPWWLTNGGYPVTDDYRKPNLSDPRVVEAVAFVRDLVQKYKVSPDPTSVDVYSQFAAGKFAMIGAGRWPLPGWSAASFTDYTAHPWPKRVSHTTVVGGSGWALSTRAVKPDIAWAAIDYLLLPSSVARLTEVGQALPVYPGIGDDTGDKAADRAFDVLFRQLDDSRPVAAPAFYDTLESVAMRYLQQIVSGRLDPAKGLRAADAEIKEAL